MQRLCVSLPAMYVPCPPPQPMVLSSNGEEAKEQVDTFRVSPRFPILIASYESVRRHAKGLSGLCQVLVCDEAHRLKSAAGNKTIR